jgi:hypothetical protein
LACRLLLVADVVVEVAPGEALLLRLVVEVRMADVGVLAHAR